MRIHRAWPDLSGAWCCSPPTQSCDLKIGKLTRVVCSRARGGSQDPTFASHPLHSPTAACIGLPPRPSAQKQSSGCVCTAASIPSMGRTTAATGSHGLSQGIPLGIPLVVTLLLGVSLPSGHALWSCPTGTVASSVTVKNDSWTSVTSYFTGKVTADTATSLADCLASAKTEACVNLAPKGVLLYSTTSKWPLPVFSLCPLAVSPSPLPAPLPFAPPPPLIQQQ